MEAFDSTLLQFGGVFSLIVVGIWKLAKDCESLLKAEVISGLAAWLKNDRISNVFKDWTYSFTQVYDYVFCTYDDAEISRAHGQCPLPSIIRIIPISLAFLLITVILSLISFNIPRFLEALLSSEISISSQNLGINIITSRFVRSYFLLICIYVALYYFVSIKTRLLLNRMQGKGFIVKLLLLMVDLIANIMAFLVIYQSAEAINFQLTLNYKYYLSNKFNSDVENAYYIFHTLTLPLCIAVFSQSIWAILFWVSSIFAKTVNVSLLIMRVPANFFDVDKHPLMAIAASGIFLITFGYWIPVISYIAYQYYIR